MNLLDVVKHRNVDAAFLSLCREHADSVKTAIICPPLIYGPGRGPCNTTSMQAYWMSSIVLEREKGFLIGTGKTWISEIHFYDLVNLELQMGDAAISNDTTATWGSHGFYFAENGMWQWGDMFHYLAKIAKDRGYI